MAPLSPSSFGQHALALVESLGLDGRVDFAELSRTHAVPLPPQIGEGRARRVPRATLTLISADNMTGGGAYLVILDRRKTSVVIDLGEWQLGLRSDKDAQDALERVEAALTPLVNLKDLNSEVTRVPGKLASIYTATIDPANDKLTINPRPRPRPGARRLRSRGAGVTAERTREGGRRIGLELADGSPVKFGDARWTRMSFADAIEASMGAHHQDVGAAELNRRIAQARVAKAGHDLNTMRDVLRATAQGQRDPIFLFLSADADHPGLVSVCREVTVMDFDPTLQSVFRLRKPVVYFWPTERIELTVEVELEGEFVSQYPKQNAGPGRWEFIATPDGVLFDPATERKFSYLFWEGAATGFAIDRERAHCVAGEDAATFLEKVAFAYQLNDKERTDFVSYWLPALEANPFNVVQLLDAEAYRRYATMRITPAPDTVIRLFMIFERADGPTQVGAPELPTFLRAGFCVIEWGGVNLDEVERGRE